MHLFSRRCLAGFVLGLALIGAWAADSSAQGLKPAIVAVVDYDAILRDASAAESIRDQLAAIRDKYQAEIDVAEAELKATQDELSRQQAILSPEAYQEKRREFEARVAEVNGKAQRLNRSLERTRIRAIQEVQQNIVAIIAELAEERGFTLAVPSGMLLFAADGLSVSDEVLRRLNQRLPRVDVVVEGS